MNFDYDAHMQSYPNTMNYSSLQASDFNSRRFTPLDIKVKQYTCGYIMHMFSTRLFSDSTTS